MAGTLRESSSGQIGRTDAVNFHDRPCERPEPRRWRSRLALGFRMAPPRHEQTGAEGGREASEGMPDTIT